MMVNAEFRSENGEVNTEDSPVCIETKPIFFSENRFNGGSNPS